MALKIACTAAASRYFTTARETISPDETDFTDVAAAVITSEDAPLIRRIDATCFRIPVFLLRTDDELFADVEPGSVYRIMDTDHFDRNLYSRQIEAAAAAYETNLLPPFFGALKAYVEEGNSEFDCPGHQGGQYFRRHPAGRLFYEFFGENLFRADICNADVKLGDLLIHEGYPYAAQQHAAHVFNADKTYFVLNGTSTANKVVTGALLTPGDLVLFDRNNHKSVHQGALTLAGARAVYLETARNPFGFIGGVDDHCFDEAYLRKLAADIDPERAARPRPFRLAVIQLGTYDGTIYNARQVVDRIGKLCDYIFFDSAWVGYEQFIPMMKDASPLLLELGPDDPGIIVTQSVHKQQAGFSQASQIHKKDSHIRGQRRYCDHKHFNNSYMLHASTSPFYPLFASLDVNARMQEGDAGRKLWMDCVKAAIEARKSILRHCRLIRPFIPELIYGRKWETYPTEKIANDLSFFRFRPEERWHLFEGYGPDQYFVDPCKLLLTTPGINRSSGEYDDFGIPAAILASYLRENGIIPEKSDLNSILFLLTPAETRTKLENLVSHLVRFERAVQEDRPLSEVLPSIYTANRDRYQNHTIAMLCQEMHDFYREHDVKTLQKRLFRRDYFPEARMTPQEAHYAFIRNECELVPLSEIRGRVALEGALPYPPGILCVVPGEVWNETAQAYFLTLEEGINRFPGFAPEIQGVYLEETGGRITGYGHVLKEG